MSRSTGLSVVSLFLKLPCSVADDPHPKALSDAFQQSGLRSCSEEPEEKEKGIDL